MPRQPATCPHLNQRYAVHNLTPKQIFNNILYVVDRAYLYTINIAQKIRTLIFPSTAKGSHLVSVSDILNSFYVRIPYLPYTNFITDLTHLPLLDHDKDTKLKRNFTLIPSFPKPQIQTFYYYVSLTMLHQTLRLCRTEKKEGVDCLWILHAFQLQGLRTTMKISVSCPGRESKGTRTKYIKPDAAGPAAWDKKFGEIS
jgi:hypothetical protein